MINISDYPAGAALALELMSRHRTILQDALAPLKSGGYSAWPEPINLGGWSVHGLKWQGKMLDGWDRHSAGRLAAICPMIVNCGYSLMEPGAEIAPHVGYTDRVLRMHLGLSVPEGDCAIVIDGQTCKWETGRVLMFDDTLRHSAHNRTGEPRLILLLDLDKAMVAEVQA